MQCEGRDLNATGDDERSIEKTAGSPPDANAVPSEPAPVQTTVLEAEHPEPAEQPKDETIDAVEADLERRIVEAELAGRSTVADVLARRLDAHRKARTAGPRLRVVRS
jgi:hypothetical protein